MKKALRSACIIMATVLTLMFFGLPVSAAATFTLPKTNTPPAIDGILDEGVYTKLHDFYGMEGFKLDADPDKTIKGTTYASYDDSNFYVFTVVESEKHDSTGPAIDMGEGTVGYLAMLATAPGAGWTEETRFEIGCGVKNDGTQEWKVCSPADIKDSSDGGGTDFWNGKCPFQFKVIRDDAAKKTYYEWAVPWSLLDRTNKISFTEGHEVTYNYVYNVHTEEEYFANQRHVVELGGGIWTGTYEDGMIIKLGAAPAVPQAEAPAEATPTPTAPAAAANPVTSDSIISVFAILMTLSAAVFTAARKLKRQ